MRGFASREGLDVYEVLAPDGLSYVSLLVSSASATDSSSAEIVFNDEGCLDEFIERLRAARTKVFGPLSKTSHDSVTGTVASTLPGSSLGSGGSGKKGA